MTGVSKVTILKLLVELGAARADYMDVTTRDLPCQRLQADETWAFCFAKQKNVKAKHFENGGYAGDIWTWVAIDADTKLIPSWLIGMRDTASARTFVEDLAGRHANRVQLTTDGLKLYINAVDRAFGEEIDYAMRVKIYGQIDADGQRRSFTRRLGKIAWNDTKDNRRLSAQQVRDRSHALGRVQICSHGERASPCPVATNPLSRLPVRGSDSRR